MNLVERVKGVFRSGNDVVQPVEEPKPEQLVSVVVPRKVLTKRDYKERGIVDAGELGKYFHGCAFDVARSLVDVYGDFFDVAKKEGDRKVEYVFARGNRTVTYAIIGLNGFESDDGQMFSSDVTGLFVIQEPIIDFQRAGVFINSMMGSHLLDYRKSTEAKFGLFYGGGKASEKGPKLEGLPLLRLMGVRPTEAAEFVQVMYFGGYRHKIFEKGELDL